MTSLETDCPLCRQDGGLLLFRGKELRVVEADDPNYPGFTRVIWNAHVAEMTDLSATRRDTIMQAVWTVEQVLRDILLPDKINLATLGNMVPHLHWHVIPRWRDDPHFPDAIWAAPRAVGGVERSDRAQSGARLLERLPCYRRTLVAALACVVDKENEQADRGSAPKYS